MPAFLAHFCILDMAYSKLSEKSKFLIKEPRYQSSGKIHSAELSQWAYLGAIGPDICGAEETVEWVFDVIHWKKSNSFVANWIEKLDPDFEEFSESVHLAFLFGFLSHMAGDTIVHPYVNTFAGVLDRQSISVAVKKSPIPVPIFGIFGYAFPKAAHEAEMHRFVELHQDAYVAERYYGAKSLSAGDDALLSWNSFFRDAVKDQTHKKDYSGLLKRYVDVTNETYNVPSYKKALTNSYLEKAVNKICEVGLGLGYDGAMGPVPNHPEDIFVQHPKRDRNYDSYLWAAAFTTTKYWEAAMDFLYSPMDISDRKAFMKVIRNFNLDTGFAPRVYSNQNRIYIRHDHSWSLLLEKPTQAFDPEMPKK